MKIVLFSPPFIGHLTVIKQLQFPLQLHYPCFEIEIIIVDHGNSNSTHPMIFVPEVAARELPVLLERNWSDVILIIYDFFAIEGLIIAKKFNIPCICSIPAILSNQINDKYYQECIDKWGHHLRMLEQKFEVKLPQPQLASDGWLLSGDVNILWNYSALGKIDREHLYYLIPPTTTTIETNKKKKVYFSLGTIVPNDLFNKNPESRAFILSFYRTVITYFEQWNHIILHMSCPFKEITSNASNIVIEPYWDQKKELKDCSLFITHGGGNSFNEAIAAECPMLVYPFFGDQFVTARYIVEYDLGKCLLELSDDFGHLTTDLTMKTLNLDCIPFMFTNMNIYINNIQKIKAISKNDDLINILNKVLTFPNLWEKRESGTLLYGTTEDRIYFGKAMNMDFSIAIKNQRNRYYTIDELGLKEPIIMDHWNDLLLSDWRNNKNLTVPIIEQLKSMEIIWKQIYKNNLEQGLRDMCCWGLNNFPVHFIIRNFKEEKNPVTYQEIQTLLEINKKDIIFWVYDREINNYKLESHQNIHRILRQRHQNIKSLMELRIPSLYQELKREIKALLPKENILKSTLLSASDIGRKELKYIPNLMTFQIIFDPKIELDKLSEVLSLKFPLLQINKMETHYRGQGLYKRFGFEIYLWSCLEYFNAL